ncbi:MAG: hypothetical protein NZ653_10030 [Anaerolineae bacterium]|nr:hypothetical protein [Anaerolineae bacterium]
MLLLTVHVTFQIDWGQELGGDNLEKVAALEERFLKLSPGRKGYNVRQRGATELTMRNLIPFLLLPGGSKGPISDGEKGSLRSFASFLDCPFSTYLDRRSTEFEYGYYEI